MISMWACKVGKIGDPFFYSLLESYFVSCTLGKALHEEMFIWFDEIGGRGGGGVCLEVYYMVTVLTELVTLEDCQGQ